MTTCCDAAASFSDFFDGVLPSERRQALGVHLRQCEACAQVLRDLRCTRRLLRRLPRERMPDPMKNTLLDELRRSRTLPHAVSSPSQPETSHNRDLPEGH